MEAPRGHENGPKNPAAEDTVVISDEVKKAEAREDTGAKALEFEKDRENKGDEEICPEVRDVLPDRMDPKDGNDDEVYEVTSRGLKAEFHRKNFKD